ncbi:MAG: DUF2975 domain-containing protein [Bacteroidetes bacterium]|nr:DUF2975 domain-containing protein [Bacteroidota bacterium]
MRRTLTLSFQAVIVLIGIVVLVMLIRLPLTEGRATNLDLFSIYSDPFILYGYAASIAFFVGLFKAFKLLALTGQGKLYSSGSVEALNSIKYCAIIFAVLIVGAGLYIKLFHNNDDDPTGFLALCIVTTFLSMVTAGVSARFERRLQIGMEMKSGNDLTT